MYVCMNVCVYIYIYIYVCVCVCVCVYILYMCVCVCVCMYRIFVTHPKKQWRSLWNTFLWTWNKAAARYGCHYCSCVWTPDCWLEGSEHLEVHATGQGFPWFYPVLVQMLNWHPNSTLYCVCLMLPSQNWLRNCRRNAAIRTSPKFCHNAVLQTQNLAQILNFSPLLLLLLHTPNISLSIILPCHFQMFYLATGQPLPERRAGTPWDSSGK